MSDPVPGWRTSTYTHPNGNCVEIGRAGGGVAIRDSKHRRGGVLLAGPRQWADFLAALRSGRYDR
ncbi:DUF397 domain-containing protein [Saccharopolyspora sp. MS10]|uniref:DUF397 domain-containing protein n=1 Tax=Saccharopolyspora sp. MS10 TaxID=3385973 RepID=UPI0039A1A554